MRNDKFKALVHYVCDQCVGCPERLGATKLNKILWFSDVLAYVSLGEAITGEEYIKRQFGPVPRTILEALRELENEGQILIREMPSYYYSQRLFLSLTKADETVFSTDQLHVIDGIIDWIVYEHTASTISRLSHNDSWKAARIGEVIPHHAYFASFPREINEHDIAWAEKVLEEHLAVE